MNIEIAVDDALTNSLYGVVYEINVDLIHRYDVLIEQTMEDFYKSTFTQFDKDYYVSKALKQFRNINRAYERIRPSLPVKELHGFEQIMYVVRSEFFAKITKLKLKEVKVGKRTQMDPMI